VEAWVVHAVRTSGQNNDKSDIALRMVKGLLAIMKKNENVKETRQPHEVANDISEEIEAQVTSWVTLAKARVATPRKDYY